MNNEHKYLQWFSSQTKSIYWHDSAVRAEQQAAFANGATGMTTNPFLIQSTLNGDRAFWAGRLAAIPQDLKGDEKVYALMPCVTGYDAEQTRPIFEKGVPGEGYVCAQTNPNKTGDAEYMIEQDPRLLGAEYRGQDARDQRRYPYDGCAGLRRRAQGHRRHVVDHVRRPEGTV